MDYEEQTVLDENSKPSEYQSVISLLESKLKDGDEHTKAKEATSPQSIPASELLTLEQKDAIMQIVETALDHMGSTGKEILLGLLYKRYGVVKQDIIDAPGRFMNALRVLLGSTASVLERDALDQIEVKLKVSASSLEEAIATMRGPIKFDGPAEKVSPSAKGTKKVPTFHYEYHTPSESPPSS